MKEVKLNDDGNIKMGLLVENENDLREIFKSFFNENYDHLDHEYTKNMWDYVPKDEVVVFESETTLENGKRYPLLTTYHESKIL